MPRANPRHAPLPFASAFEPAHLTRLEQLKATKAQLRPEERRKYIGLLESHFAQLEAARKSRGLQGKNLGEYFQTRSEIERQRTIAEKESAELRARRDAERAAKHLGAAMSAGQIVKRIGKKEPDKKRLERDREQWVKRARKRTHAPSGDDYQFLVYQDLLAKTNDGSKAKELYGRLGASGVKALASNLKERGRDWNETLETDWDRIIEPTLEIRDRGESIATAILRKDMIVRRFGKNGDAELDRVIKELGDFEGKHGWEVLFSNWEAIRPYVAPNEKGRSKIKVTPDLIVTLIRERLAARKAKAER